MRNLQYVQLKIGRFAPKDRVHDGMFEFLITIEQKKREQLLDVTKAQVKEAAQKYLVASVEKGEERIAFLREKQGWVDDKWTIKDMDVKGAE